MRASSPQRGFALVLSVFILSLVAILGIALIRTTKSDRTAANNYRLEILAKLAADAGIEQARGQLLEHYARQLLDASDAPWRCGDPELTPMEELVAPSFHLETHHGDGQARGFSGSIRLAETGSLNRVRYTVRVSDLNARLNLNDANPHLAALLDRLGEGIARYEGTRDPLRGRGARLIAARDERFGGAFGSIEQLRQLDWLDERDRAVLRRYVTLRSWRDPSVLAPDAGEPPEARPGVTPWNRLLARGLGPAPPRSLRFALASRPSATRPIQGRAPINLNTASRAVLFAWLCDLEAFGYQREEATQARFEAADLPDDRRGDALLGLSDVRPDERQQRRRHASRTLALRGEGWRRVRLGPILPAEAARLVERIDSRRRERPLQSLHDLAALLPETRRGLILANANPNARLGCRLNPDLAWSGDADPRHLLAKPDLVRWSSEAVFCARGRFHIESLGRVYDSKDRAIGRALKGELVELFRVAKHTTQADFLRAEDGSLGMQTLPENIADQTDWIGDDAQAGGSRLDGAVTMRPNLRRHGASWIAPLTRDFDGRAPRKRTGFEPPQEGSGPRRAGRERLSDERQIRGRRAPAPPREHAPRSLPQRPASLTILGSSTASGSHLMPDGRRSHPSRCGRRQLTWRLGGPAAGSTVPGPLGPSLHPQQGAVEFWWKPEALGDLRLDHPLGLVGRTLLGDDRRRASLLNATWLGASTRAGARGGLETRVAADERALDPSRMTALEIYSLRLDWEPALRCFVLRARGGHFRLLGSVHPDARTSEIGFPAGRHYDGRWRVQLPALLAQHWNHLRVSWRDFDRPSLSINGRAVALEAAPGARRGRGQPLWVGDALIDRFNLLDESDGRRSALALAPVSQHGLSGASRIAAGTLGCVRGFREASGRVPARASDPRRASQRVPDRIEPSDGRVRYAGRFTVRSAERSCRALSLRFTAYPGLAAADPRQRAAEMSLEVGDHQRRTRALGHSLLSPPALLWNASFSPQAGLPYRVLAFDRGQRPFCASPLLDDVTLLYVAGPPRVIRRWETVE